jgi:two-component system OmpR family sensor kinase
MSSGRIGQAWGSLRGLPDRTPLRVKMVTAVLALVAIALVAISFVGIAFLKDYLLNGADAQLLELYQNAPHLQNGHNATTVSPEPWLYEALLPNEGLQRFGGYLPPGISGPAISTDASWLSASTPTSVTVPAQSGSELWRVVAYPGQTFYIGNGQQQLGTLIVGIDVTSIYNTIGNLIRIDVIVSVIVLIALFIVGIAVVRASLRPLTDIEKTAGAIAAGDLTRRVPDLDPRTEVGRLGQSLNTMLSQIETAFDARAESELAARRSEERMRQFVADASHELRTPLTAIRGFAEYYRQRGGAAAIPGAAGSLPPGSDADGAAADAGGAVAEAGAGTAEAGAGTAEAGTGTAEAGTAVSPRHGSNAEPAERAGSGPLPRADLDRIMQRVEQESFRMGGLVEDMLLLARLDQQRPLELRTVDMLTLAADAVHDARVVAPDRSINLTVGSGAALLVLGDEARLRQVVGNLINNAISHTPEGSAIEVRVRLGSLDEWRPAAAAAARRAAANREGQGAFAAASPNVQPFPAMVFEIADQGPGLTQAQAEHVFERFYRADQARTRQSGGAGLGLAIVAALVAAHGGNVWVESPPGGGAIFRIAIPLAPEARNSGPDLDDGTDPDILNSNRRTLNAQSAVARGPGHAAPPTSSGPGYPAPPDSSGAGYPAPPASSGPGHAAPPTSSGPGYPAPPSAFPKLGHPKPDHVQPGHAQPRHAEPPGPAGPASAGSPAAPPLPKRRPGYSGHTRI